MLGVNVDAAIVSETVCSTMKSDDEKASEIEHVDQTSTICRAHEDAMSENAVNESASDIVDHCATQTSLTRCTTPTTTTKLSTTFCAACVYVDVDVCSTIDFCVCAIYGDCDAPLCVRGAPLSSWP